MNENKTEKIEIEGIIEVNTYDYYGQPESIADVNSNNYSYLNELMVEHKGRKVKVTVEFLD